MNDEINYKNNPLNGVGLKRMLTELTNHYGFDILFAYLNINCFRNNPSVASSIKFLKKTDWAREKVEGFYLYSFKSLPKASHQQSQLSPRDRIVPDEQSVGEPAELTLADAELVREERELRAAEFDSNTGSRTSSGPISRTATSADSGSKSNSLSGTRHETGVSAERKDPQSENSDNDSAPKNNSDSSASTKRLPSTADNPWGLPKK